MIQTLQKKFIVTAMTAVTILLVLMLGTVVVLNAWSSAREEDALLDDLLRMQTDDRPDGRDGPRQRQDEPDQPGGRPSENDRLSALFFTVTAEDGTAVAADVSRIRSVTEDEALALGQKALDAGEETGRVSDFRYAFAEKRDGGSVGLFLETSVRRAAALRVALLALLAGAGGWVLMLLFVIFLSRRAIRPIAENMERQRQFVTDAGHELKTPLAIIQANAEAMELIQGETKWSKNIRAQVTRLTGLTQNLLTLARAEEAPAAGAAEPVDLSALGAQTLESYGSSLELRGLRCDKDLEPGLWVRVEKARLSSLLSLLLDNAVKYTSEGGNVTLRTGRHGEHPVLRLENDCDALPACPPERLFDRFYRADEARTQKHGGFGIGLSAAKALAGQLGAELRAEYVSERRIAFVLVFAKEAGGPEKN